jgi:hypothetical protein
MTNRDRMKDAVKAAHEFTANKAMDVSVRWTESGQTTMKWSKGMNGESLSFTFQTKSDFLEACEAFEMAKKQYLCHPANK